jgi:hypothetical protein
MNTLFLSGLALLCGIFAIGFTFLAVITIITDLKKESKN